MTLDNDGKLDLAWDSTRPVRRDEEWVGVEHKARTFVLKNTDDPELILDMLGLTTQ